MMEGNRDLVKKFSTFLESLKIWGSYKTDPWVAGVSLKHLKGKHTKQFMTKIYSIFDLLKFVI